MRTHNRSAFLLGTRTGVTEQMYICMAACDIHAMPFVEFRVCRICGLVRGVSAGVHIILLFCGIVVVIGSHCSSKSCLLHRVFTLHHKVVIGLVELHP